MIHLNGHLIKLKRQSRKSVSLAVSTVLVIGLVIGVLIIIQEEIYAHSIPRDNDNAERKYIGLVQKLKHIGAMIAGLLEFIRNHPEILIPSLAGLAVYEYLARKGNYKRTRVAFRK